ncbi:hypothetical protein B0J12DRAFT_755370 [Macrophomina phaseolina]|uniref:Uncharacterized protein n=1 Tax=Macrophomina phaseolina TaxID=35725 RepID=A0ABQ8G8X4_9PEZI|nr:hypothetical protein B0J12DRAFT_755370 [Macrophomina phaseolina]
MLGLGATLANIVAAAVLAGGLGLCSARAIQGLLKSHMALDRKRGAESVQTQVWRQMGLAAFVSSQTPGGLAQSLPTGRIGRRGLGEPAGPGHGPATVACHLAFFVGPVQSPRADPLLCVLRPECRAAESPATLNSRCDVAEPEHPAKTQRSTCDREVGESVFAAVLSAPCVPAGPAISIADRPCSYWR